MTITHLSRPRPIGGVALSFLVPSFVCSSVRPAMVTSDQISTFFNIYRHKSLVLTQFLGFHIELNILGTRDISCVLHEI